MLQFNSSLDVLPLSHQSYNISFTDWITIFTLCLAPLIAHIIAGVSRTSYLCSRQLKWHEIICYYNLTSIMWRYVAITDRRLRARFWDRMDLAASNTLFWTSRGWDGSESMIILASPYCFQLPERASVTVLSLDMLKTVIVTCQGIQAVKILWRTIAASSTTFMDPYMATDTIFFPLAIIGLLRLYCGLWLSEDYAYALLRSEGEGNNPTETNADRRRPSVDCLIPEYPHILAETRFRPTSFWGSQLFRAFFILQLIGMFFMSFLFLFMLNSVFTVTVVSVILFYMILVGTTTITFSYYFIRGYTVTTIIPCIGTTWYKVYTGIIMGFAVMILTVSCIETRRTLCGVYTSAPVPMGDYMACWAGTGVASPVGYGGPLFGLAGAYRNGYQNETTKPGSSEYVVYNFTGLCFGELKVLHPQRIRVEDIAESRGD